MNQEKLVRDKSGAVINTDSVSKEAYKAARARAKRLDALELEVRRLNMLVAAMAKKLGVEIE